MKMKNPCLDCHRPCVNVCSAGAISPSEKVAFSFAGLKVEMAKIDKPAWAWYHGRMSTKAFGTVELEQPENITWEKVREARKIADDRFLVLVDSTDL